MKSNNKELKITPQRKNHKSMTGDEMLKKALEPLKRNKE